MDAETATAIPRSPVAVTVTARGHTLVQDKPAAYGGADQGMMASELLLASLLGCQHSTLVKVAAKRRMDVGVRNIHGTLRFDEAGDIVAIDLHFDLRLAHGVADESVQTLLRLTEKACTISRVLKVPVEWAYSRSSSADVAPAAKANST